MKRVSYEAGPPKNDEMGSARRVKITIPAPDQSSVKATFESLKSNSLELESIFE